MFLLLHRRISESNYIFEGETIRSVNHPSLKPFFCILIVLISVPLRAQTVNTFAHSWDPLHVRADKADAIMRGNHWNEGTMLPDVIFPPVGLDRPIVGSQEDASFETGLYLAAMSFRYAVTKDPQVRQWADQAMDGVLKLEAVTGQSGCMARSFNKTEKPLPHEKWFFFPMEWHESKSMPGYRWVGDFSSDQFTSIVFGVSVYFDLCADEAHKKIATEFIDRLLGRVVDNNFKIVDFDNKMTLWGNFCPDLPHENLNALEILSHLRTAHHVTGKERYLNAYNELIQKHHYDDQAILAKVIWPKDHRNTSDDELAGLSLYALLIYEQNPSLRMKYRMSLSRHWTVIEDDKNAFFRMLRLLAFKAEESESDREKEFELLYEDLRHARGPHRRHDTMKILPDGDELERLRPEHIRVEREEGAGGYLRDYWMARFYNFIDGQK